MTKQLTQVLIDNQDTLIEGAIYGKKESVPSPLIFFHDEAEALRTIRILSDETDYLMRKARRSEMDVHSDFNTDTLKKYRRDLRQLLSAVLGQIAETDRMIESISYWKFEKEYKNELCSISRKND